MKQEKVLEIDQLKTYFQTKKGVGKVVDGIDLVLHKGETLGIVGESGCGKSMTSLSILQLIPDPGKIVAGSIRLNNEELIGKSEKQMRTIRGNQISMIFQEPMTSLNPVISVGEQIAETIREHQGLSRKQAFKKSIEMLELVGIPSPEQRAKQEPFQLSGGMRQRVMIAMALACNPEVLIADEPTTALDVTIQSQIIKLMKDLQKKLNMGVVFITHDLGVVAETCDKVAVMYAGEIVEYSTTEKLFRHPKHPYTKGLLRSLPKLYEDQEELMAMEGSIPSPFKEHQGCKFADRCPIVEESCHHIHPNLKISSDESYQVRCLLHQDDKEIKEGVSIS
ncbi:ABC transporter ATP-binding protein [Virgibacillus necropolis]|uniref:Peptide ABC transporter ATP-binding protein n=1 Tax=Virgibacillus necropolis TaxID=163877 RepID=A0A221MEW6_9BACI|nr:ABC transporter ATP-binding protein [Virgibacillus necropolis]ASN06216.1 peptide ABC transporter ATP-binding protein [Virgibacillus necropolis]